MDWQDLWSNGCLGTTTGALGKALLARTTAGQLLGLDGWSQESGTIYLFVFDSAAIVASANPPIPWPKHVIEVLTPASSNGNFGLTIPPSGEYYANGIYVAVSTTAPPNFTLTTSSLTHLNVQHAPQAQANLQQGQP